MIIQPKIAVINPPRQYLKEAIFPFLENIQKKYFFFLNISKYLLFLTQLFILIHLINTIQITIKLALSTSYIDDLALNRV